MTTTSKYQILPDFYSKIEECNTNEIKHSKIITNSRYNNFNQVHFTSGDELQFQEYRDNTNNEKYNSSQINLDKNIFIDIFDDKDIYWEGYKDLEADCVDNTFLYMFHKFKKGIFIKIKDNELKVFLPFSKNNFINEWGDRIKYDPKKYKNMNEFLEMICNQQGYKFNPKRVNKDTNTWYSNNCLVRYEYPMDEGDSGVCNMSDMFKTLCKSRKIPDIEFFINKRDFPLLKRNLTEPYENMFDDDNYPLLSHKYDKYSPILGGSITSEYADISIPTWKDWARISSKENKFFVKSCNQDDICNLESVPWENKIPTAIFRGSSTGCGVDINTNPRLKLAYLSSITPEEDGYKLIDAGITKWNLRPRKIKGNPYLQTIDVNKQPSLVNYLSPSEQCKYKYIINVDGHVTAFRISLEMNMESVILLVESKYSIWFMKYLKPYIHYIPIKRDLSDLISKIRWCRNNDDKCKEIIKNCKDFYKTYLEKDGILDYLQILLVKLKNIIGTYFYNVKDPLYYQIEYEKKMLYTYKYFPTTIKTITDINYIPKNERFYSTLKGLEWIFNFIKSKDTNLYKYFDIDNLEPISKTKNTIIYKTLLANYPIIIKICNDITPEVIHEAFISHNCINNFIKKVPNFEYIFGTFEYNSKICICAEYLKTELTFDKYILQNYKNIDFFKNYLNVLIQIAFSLDMAQKECCFVHNDLLPWNILIKEYEIPIKIDYMISPNNIYNITTKIVPVIIDYGKSHVVYNNIHYGINNRYKTSTINDIIMLLLKSLKVLLNNEVPQEMLKHILYISNFISKTRFYTKEFNKISDLKMFLNINTKYTNLLLSDKYELENLTPFDFIKYIISYEPYIKYKHLTISETYKLRDIGDPKQIFNFILSSNDKDRIYTYIEVIDTITKLKDIDNLITNPNLFLLHLFYQRLDKQIEGNKYTFQNFINYIVDIHIYDKYINEYFIKYNDLKKNLDSKFKYHVSKCSYLSETYGFIDHLDSYYTKSKNIILFDNKDLLCPEKIYDILLYKKNYNFKNILKIKELITEVLYSSLGGVTDQYNSNYKMNKEIVNYYLDKFKNILYINNVYFMNNIANVCTLINLTSKMYKDNIEYIENIDIQSINFDKEKYIKIYKKILELNSEIIIILND